MFELFHVDVVRVQPDGSHDPESGHASKTPTSSTKAQLLDVAEQLFLRSGLGVSVRDITDAAGQNGAAIHYHFGSRDALVGAVIARRAHDLAARRRAALQALRDAPTPPTIRDVVAGLVGAYVGMVEAEGPDAQRWVDLMHALWLDRSPTLAFMSEQAADERDWSRLARAALPHLSDDVFGRASSSRSRRSSSDSARRRVRRAPKPCVSPHHLPHGLRS